MSKILNLDKEYKFNNIRISSNYMDMEAKSFIWNYKTKDKDFIHIENIDDLDHIGISCTLQEAEFMIEILSKIVKEYKECFPYEIKQKVKIINGRFKDFEGYIYDIDKMDKEKPLIITISGKINEFSDFKVYLHYNDVEIID